MSTSILAVTHSVGDTDMTLASAKELAKKDISTTLLIVGGGAKGQWEKAEKNFSEKEKTLIKARNLDEFFEEVKPVTNSLLELTAAQLKKLISALDFKTYNGLLVGMPSYADVNKQCKIPGQLLKEFAPFLPASIFMSDYAFYDPQHVAVKESWFKGASKFIVPFKKAIGAYQVDPEKTVVVGHPSIDAAKEKFGQWIAERQENADAKIAETRKKLQLAPQEKFIFVAAGKSGDEELIAALSEVIAAYPDIKVEIGLHPFAEESYREKLQSLIDKGKGAKQMVLLPKNLVTTDDAVYAANSVLTVSSTVGTTTAACGKLAGFYQENKLADDASLPFIIGDSPHVEFCNKPAQLHAFMLETQKRSALFQKEDIIGTARAAEKIADEMQKTLSNKI